MGALARYRSTLDKIRHDKIGTTDDEDRDLLQ